MPSAASSVSRVRARQRRRRFPVPRTTAITTSATGSAIASRHLLEDQLVCECELISRRKFEEASRWRPTTDLDDIRRTLRLGMGPCQGGFCIYRATGILHGLDGIDTAGANTALLEFVRERWKGTWPIMYGDQLRQARFDEWVLPGRARHHAPAGMRPSLTYDAVVLGAGVAGLTAAARLAEGGAKVCVLAKGVGSTHLAPGTVDVLGYDPGRVEAALRRASGLHRRPPRTPLRDDRRRRDRSRARVVRRQGRARSSARLPLHRRARAQPPAADSGRARSGRPRSCRRRWLAGDLATATPVCVVGMRVLRDFHPSLCAGNLQRAGI